MKRKAFLTTLLAGIITASAVCMTGCGVNGYSTKAAKAGIQVTEAATSTSSKETKTSVKATGSKTDYSQAESATIMIYMNGSNLESEDGDATTDLLEMVHSGSFQNVNVLVETVGTSQWSDTFGIASDHTQIYKVTADGLELVNDELGQLDCTDPSTLGQFIKWSAANYPADRYELIMWDHGGGPVYGYGYDENVEDEEASLSIDEMQTALEEGGVHFDMIGFDACIMGSVEVCRALENYCSYAVVSEDFESSLGWNYTNWLAALDADPAIATEDLGKIIVDDYVEANENDEEGGADGILALVDESRTEALFEAWKNFAYANQETLLETDYSQEITTDADGRVLPILLEKSSADYKIDQTDLNGWLEDIDWSDYADDETLSSWLDEMGWSGYADADDYSDWTEDIDWSDYMDDADYNDWSNGSWGDEDMQDVMEGLFDMFYDFSLADYYITDLSTAAEAVSSDESAALISALEDAVVYVGATSGESELGGLSVTLPYGDAEFYAELETVFTNAGFDEEYVTWLGQFTSVEGTSDSYNDTDSWYEDNMYGYDNGDSWYEDSDLYGYDDEDDDTEIWYENSDLYGYEDEEDGTGSWYGDGDLYSNDDAGSWHGNSSQSSLLNI